MTTKFDHLQYSPIWNHHYERWFQEFQHNGNKLDATARNEFVEILDETIFSFSKGLPILKGALEQIKDLHDEFHEAYSWWKDERNVETHLDTEKLYVSRCEEVVESKVMMDSLKLYNTLYAVNLFLTNAHSCFYNYLLTKYKQGELKEK